MINNRRQSLLISSSRECQLSSKGVVTISYIIFTRSSFLLKNETGHFTNIRIIL